MRRDGRETNTRIHPLPPLLQNRKHCQMQIPSDAYIFSALMSFKTHHTTHSILSNCLCCLSQYMRHDLRDQCQKKNVCVHQLINIRMFFYSIDIYMVFI